MMTLPLILSTVQAKTQGKGHAVMKFICILVDYLRVPESMFWGWICIEFALLTLQIKAW